MSERTEKKDGEDDKNKIKLLPIVKGYNRNTSKEVIDHMQE